MENPLISVIVPVYNVEKYVDACIESICRQSYTNLEILLIDDGSVDSSGQRCDIWAGKDKRIRVVHKTNGGLSDARNVGIGHASGELFSFVDSDDTISPDLITYLYHLLVTSGGEISICDPVHCYPNTQFRFSSEKNRKVFSNVEAIEEMLYQKSFLVSAWAKLFSRTLFDGIRFPEGKLFEDSAVMYRLFDRANLIAYGDAKLYGYMHRDNSITSKSFSTRDCDIIAISDEIVFYFEDRDEGLRKSARSYQAACLLRVYMNAPRDGKYETQVARCENYLNKNAKQILRDKKIRRKMKFALLMYLLARPLMPFVYKKVNRWS